MAEIEEKILEIPLDKNILKTFKVGDVIRISGIVYTLRDKAHQRAITLYKEKKKTPVDLKNAAIIHCGPIAKKTSGKWKIVSAGPTTSMRLEKLENEFIRYSNVGMIIGKGGMGKSTARACKKFGAIYCIFPGGAGALAASYVKNVKNVFWLEELGMPEALWVFEVENFGPLIVTIDTNGENLTEEIKAKAREKISSYIR